VLGRPLGVEILAREQVTRRRPEDLEVTAWLSRALELRGGRPARREPTHRAIYQRISGQRLCRGVGEGDDQVEREEDTAQPRQRNGRDTRSQSVSGGADQAL
jgi:hypothetical protein